MNNYTIISDKKALKAFIAWLPELTATERYYLTLMTRRKYCTDEILPDIILKRIVSKKEDIFDNIKQLESSEAYALRSGVVPPQEVLALYININPRSLVVAAKNTAKSIIDLACLDRETVSPDALTLADILLELISDEPQTGIDPRSVVLAKTTIDLVCKDKQIKKSPRSIALTEIHKARGTKHFVDIDIDDPELTIEETVRLAEEVLNRDAFNIIKTRGGVHIIVEPGVAEKKDWFRQLRDRFVFDVKGDCMVPVPGGYQGGHVPVFAPGTMKK